MCDFTDRDRCCNSPGLARSMELHRQRIKRLNDMREMRMKEQRETKN